MKRQRAPGHLLSRLWSNRLRLGGATLIIAVGAALVWWLGGLMRDADVPRLIHEYGVWFYLLTFGWTFVEGETFVLVAGFFAAQGLLSGVPAARRLARQLRRRPVLLLDRPTLRAAAAVASPALALAGRRGARLGQALRRLVHPELPLHLWRAQLLLLRARHQRHLLRRFLALNCLAAFLWACVFVGGGYFCGRALERMLGDIADRVSMLALAAFVVGIIAITVIHRMHRRRRRRAASAAPASPTA